MKIMSINAGSSSLKFSLFEMNTKECIASGYFERVGLDGSFYTIKYNGEKIREEVAMPNHTVAVEVLLERLISIGIISSLDEIDGIGHRLVHGGDKYKTSVMITDEVVEDLRKYSDLAPLHNPANILGIEAVRKALPNVPMVGVFDTAFHQTMEKKEYIYPVPYEWYTNYGVRKYGFHGTSHCYISKQIPRILGRDTYKAIICHLGSGGSISAVKDGKCVDTTMGFTPLAGIMMGTRSGDIDYTLISYAMKKTGYNLEKIDSMLNRESGLEGVAGMSDLRDLDRAFEAGEEKVKLAFDMYTNKIVDYIAKYYVKLNGQVDAICFTAGGGENDSIIRGETLKKLTSLGIILDSEKNDRMIVRKGNEGIITTDNSSIPVYVVATDEELMIARDAYSFVDSTEE